MKISIITLFPEVFDPILNTSILKRAQQKGKVEFELINLRQFGEGKHKVVDDRPYGGGAGMILKAGVLAKALQWIIDKGQLTKKKLSNAPSKTRLAPGGKSQMSNVLLMSTSGTPFKQAKAQALSKLDQLIIICGHYEGVDQRFIDQYVDEEISIGDFVLTGGEIPAMAILDSIIRLLPGVLKKSEATIQESFSIFHAPTSNFQLLEYPHYTRPEVFEGIKVPPVLLSGNHQKIAEWRKQKSLEKTKKVRPDLIK